MTHMPTSSMFPNVERFKEKTVVHSNTGWILLLALPRPRLNLQVATLLLRYSCVAKMTMIDDYLQEEELQLLIPLPSLRLSSLRLAACFTSSPN